MRQRQAGAVATASTMSEAADPDDEEPLDPDVESDVQSRVWSTAMRPPQTVDVGESFHMLERHKRHDRAAGDELVRRYQPGLHRYIRVLLGARLRTQLETQDVVQDVFLKAWPKLDDFEYRGKGSIFAYLKTVAMHHVQSRGARTRLPQTGGDPTQDPFWLGFEQTTEAAAPDDLTGRELRAILDEAMSRLPEVEREIVAQRHHFGLTWEQIQADMGFPTRAAAYMAYQRAKLRWLEYAGPRLRNWMGDGRQPGPRS